MTPEERDVRFAKLPKWAQAEVDRLTRDVAYWKRKATAGPEGSNTFIDAFPAEERTPLGDSPQIAFTFGDRWHDMFRVRLDERELYVSGGDGLLIQPQSSNVVRLRIGR